MKARVTSFVLAVSAFAALAGVAGASHKFW